MSDLDIEALEKAAMAVPCRNTGRWDVVPTERDWPTGSRGVQFRVTESDYPDTEEWPIVEVDPDGYLAGESAEPIARYLALLHPRAVLSLVGEARRLRAERVHEHETLLRAERERDEARAEVERLRGLLRDLSVGPMADAYIAMRKVVDEFKPEARR